MGKTYKTAQGRSLDLEQLKLRNELTPAVGNMRVNARGDQLGPGGKVVKSREEMLDQHYQTNVGKRRTGAEPDVIPTRAGKVNTVEPKQKFAPGGIEVDANPTPTVESASNEAVPTVDPITGIASGEKTLKGGLARAVAKTREYEDAKNKPKRL
jgi:hypothetical protein